MWTRVWFQSSPLTDISAWATYGPLGLFCLVLIGVCWFFIRREAARADRWEAIAWRLIEANQTALKSTDSAHVSVSLLEDLLQRALKEK